MSGRALLHASLSLFLISFTLAALLFVFRPQPPNVGLVSVILSAGIGSALIGMAGLFAARRSIPGWAQLLGWLAATVILGVSVALSWVMVMVSGLPAAG